METSLASHYQLLQTLIPHVDDVRTLHSLRTVCWKDQQLKQSIDVQIQKHNLVQLQCWASLRLQRNHAERRGGG
jgi:hypothetical protein